MKRPSRRALKKYEAFHGHKPRKTVKLRLPPHDELLFLAYLDRLSYISDKFNGGGTGKREFFIHRFGKQVKLFTNKTGTALFIAGPGLRVTERGIVG